MSQENVEVVRNACEAWARGDFEMSYATWHPDIEWDTTHFEAWPENAVYRGEKDVRGFLEQDWLAGWDSHDAGVEAVIDAGGDCVVVFWWQRMVGRGSGVPVELNSAQICT